MKSFMKKVAALVMMLAMVAGVIAVPNVDAKAATDYYLHGYINGADVAGTNYKFENGSLSVTFSSDSYVYINDGSKDYKTEGWLGSGVTSATLKDSSTISNGDKLMVPAGNVVFTLVDNGNGSVTLSYEADFERDPSVTASPVKV